MSEPKLEWRSVSQIVTYASFKRPKFPKKCDVHKYHVWRWQAQPDDPAKQPIAGMKCQCGLLEWTHRKNL